MSCCRRRRCPRSLDACGGAEAPPGRCSSLEYLLSLSLQAATRLEAVSQQIVALCLRRDAASTLDRLDTYFDAAERGPLGPARQHHAPFLRYAEPYRRGFEKAAPDDRGALVRPNQQAKRLHHAALFALDLANGEVEHA